MLKDGTRVSIFRVVISKGLRPSESIVFTSYSTVRLLHYYEILSSEYRVRIPDFNTLSVMWF